MRTNFPERRRQLQLAHLSHEVIDALAAGATLHFMHSKFGPKWRLSTGRIVSDDVARLVIANAFVAGGGDALFPDARPQTFRAG